MSGRRKKSRSRGSLRSQGSRRVPSPGSTPQGNVATLVSVAVVNVDMEGSGAENNLERSKQQAEALAENACRSAAESNGVISSSDTSGPVTLVASRGGSLGPADSRHTPRETGVQFKTKTGPVSVIARRSSRQHAVSPKVGSSFRGEKESTFEFGSMSGKPIKGVYGNAIADYGQQDITTARGQESVTINSLSQQQRSALRKLDEVLTTPTQPRSQSFTGSLFASDTVDSETPSEHSKGTGRSSKSRRSRRSERFKKGPTGSRRSKRKPRSRRSRKTPRYRGSSRRKSRRSKSRSSRSRRGRRARRSRHSRVADKACHCEILKDMEKGTLTEAERRDLTALLECPEPFCAKCIELKRRLDLNTDIRAQEEGDAEGPIRIPIKSSKAKKPKKSKYEYMPQPTMSSMGVFCTCPECSRYRQQGEIIPVRTATEITDELKSSQSRRSAKLKAPKSRWPESTFNSKSRKDLSSRKVTRMKEMTPIGSLHSTFPITLTETKQSVLPYRTPPRKIPIVQTTPGTAGTKYWTPSPSLRTAKSYRKPDQLFGSGRARTPKSAREPPLLTSPKRTPTKVPQPISTKWSSWLQEKTVPPTVLPARGSHVALKVTEQVGTGKVVSESAPPPKSLSQTSAGPSARTITPIPLSSPRRHTPSVLTALSSKTRPDTVATLSSPSSQPSPLGGVRELQPVPTPASPGGTVAVAFPSQGDSTRAGAAVVAVAAQTGTIPRPSTTYIPERDYNPVCNCTNCKAERKIREENDLCDCYECIYEMKSSGGLKSAGKSSSTSSRKHPPRRMKAEYEWVKMLLHVQQPAGRYHTLKSKPVTYPWQKPKQRTPHSHQSGGGSYRERSTSSHLGISATPEPRTQSVGSAISSQTESSKQQLESSTGSKPSETPAKATSTTGSSYVTGSVGRTKSSLEGRSFSSIPQSDESDSWSAPSDEWTGSYLTPRSRSQSQRQSFKRR